LEHLSSLLSVELQVQREEIDHPDAVWDICSNKILLIWLCAQWSAIFRESHRGTCEEAEFTVFDAVYRQVAYQHYLVLN
jgi:hypothetical protein